MHARLNHASAAPLLDYSLPPSGHIKLHGVHRLTHGSSGSKAAGKKGMNQRGGVGRVFLAKAGEPGSPQLAAGGWFCAWEGFAPACIRATLCADKQKA